MKCIEKQALAVPSVNQFLLQYFVSCNLKKGWYISVSPTITANWEVNTAVELCLSAEEWEES